VFLPFLSPSFLLCPSSSYLLPSPSASLSAALVRETTPPLADRRPIAMALSTRCCASGSATRHVRPLSHPALLKRFPLPREEISQRIPSSTVVYCQLLWPQAVICTPDWAVPWALVLFLTSEVPVGPPQSDGNEEQRNPPFAFGRPRVQRSPLGTQLIHSRIARRGKSYAQGTWSRPALSASAQRRGGLGFSTGDSIGSPSERPICARSPISAILHFRPILAVYVHTHLIPALLHHLGFARLACHHEPSSQYSISSDPGRRFGTPRQRLSSSLPPKRTRDEHAGAQTPKSRVRYDVNKKVYINANAG